MKRCRDTTRPMLTPFHNDNIQRVGGKKVCSYGLQESSYDVTLSKHIKRFDKNASLPKGFLSVEDDFDGLNVLIEETLEEDGWLILQPGEFVLGLTNERFDMPGSVTGFLNCKSSLARLGMNMPYTTIKSGWAGYLVLEIQNINSVPIGIRVNEGIGSVYFFHVDSQEYTGQFQNQQNIQITGTAK